MTALRIGAWELDEVELWILERHWAQYGTQDSTSVVLLATGGAIAASALRPIAESLRAHAADPLVVGVDKYPGISAWHKRWRELLQRSGCVFESITNQGSGVFRGKTNLAHTQPPATPDTHERLAPYRSAMEKLEAAAASDRVLEVERATVYEGF